jgi:hypothetical protein
MVTGTKFRDHRCFLYLRARKFEPVTTFAEPAKPGLTFHGLVFGRRVVARGGEEDVQEHAERISDEESARAKSHQRYRRGQPELLTHRYRGSQSHRSERNTHK